MGRATAGVAAIRLAKNDYVVGMDVIHTNSVASMLVVTTKGMGKRTQLKEYPRQGRAGGGVRSITIIPKGGPVSIARVVNPDDDLVVISTNGQVIRIFAADIPHKGRPAQGVAVMNMREGDEVASIARIPRTDKSGKMLGDDELEVLSEDQIEAGRNGNGNGRSPEGTAPVKVARVPANGKVAAENGAKPRTSRAKAGPVKPKAEAVPAGTRASRSAKAVPVTETPAPKPRARAAAPAKAEAPAARPTPAGRGRCPPGPATAAAWRYSLGRPSSPSKSASSRSSLIVFRKRAASAPSMMRWS